MHRDTRSFYAIEYAYGRTTQNTNGNRADLIHCFNTIGERDAFVAAQEQDGADRDPIAATHARVKRALRYAEQGVPWPVPVLAR